MMIKNVINVVSRSFRKLISHFSCLRFSIFLIVVFLLISPILGRDVIYSQSISTVNHGARNIEASTEADKNLFRYESAGNQNSERSGFVVVPQAYTHSGKIPETFTANMKCHGNMIWADFFPNAPNYNAHAAIEPFQVQLKFDFENRSVEGDFCGSGDKPNNGWSQGHADFCVSVKESDLFQENGDWYFDGVWDVELDMSAAQLHWVGESQEWAYNSQSVNFFPAFHGWIEPNDGSLYTDETQPATFQFLCDFLPPDYIFEGGSPQVVQEQPRIQTGGEALEDYSQQISVVEMYDDLEEFLAGEGIDAPLPGNMVVNGLAVSSLLAAWLVLNQMAGIDAETSMQVIKSWKKGERPSIGAEAELPSEYGDVGVQGDHDEEGTSPDKKTPAKEGFEDRLLRAVEDGQDLDDAVKQTNKDIEAFEAKIPDQVKNLKVWKKYVEPKLKKIKSLAKKAELDKGRTWLDRSEKLLKLRNEVDRDLDHLPADRREGILVIERTLKVLGHFATDAYNTSVVVPAKLAGEKVLPPELSEKWNKSMDELSQGLSDVSQAVPEILHKGGRLVTDGKGQDQLQNMMENDPAPGNRKMAEEISDIRSFKDRSVPVEKFDLGKGIENGKRLWNHTMRCLFHDR